MARRIKWKAYAQGCENRIAEMHQEIKALKQRIKELEQCDTR